MVRKFISFLKLLLVFLILAAAGFFGYSIPRSGLVTIKINIAGTGSMFPTFPKGEGTESAKLAIQTVASPTMHPYPGKISLLGYTIYAYQIKHGDIVSFFNSRTKEISQRDGQTPAGFVKRVIGLPGDQLEIRDGFVWLNGVRQQEDYTATPRSTFGGNYLSDCHTLTVPPNSYFVMGDNRKGSNDSRSEIGLVADTDIDAVLPYSEQLSYRSIWRDASEDDKLANKPTLNPKDYLEQINQKRRENHLPPLKYHYKLEASAKKRAEILLQFNDFSFEATKSGYTMDKAMADVGYSNIVWGEAPTTGFYTAEELVENFFQFPNAKNFLLNKDFQETGIAVVVGKINNCPVQVIVQHLAGYKPPDYDPQMITSWQTVLSNLEQIRPGWDISTKYPDFYQKHKEDLDEITRIIDLRLERLRQITYKLTHAQWLTKTESAWLAQDASQAAILDALIQKINHASN